MLKNPKGSLLSVFRHCENFFATLFSSKGSPSISLIFYNRMNVEKSQRVPTFSFSALRLFLNLFFSKGPAFNCDNNVANFERVPLLARQGFALTGPGAPFGPFFGFSSTSSTFCYVSAFATFEPWIWHRLMPFPACSSASKVMSRLPLRISEKGYDSSSDAISFIRTKISFALLPSSVLCLRGCRALKRQIDHVEPYVVAAVHEGRLS